MPQVRTGQYMEGPNKGRKWEIYEDPASQTGWTRKNWSPSKPGTEYFEPFNADAADVDEQAAINSRRAAEHAADVANQGRVRAAAEQQTADEKVAALVRGGLEGSWKLKDREYGLQKDDRNIRRDDLAMRTRQGNRELDLREMDQRTRLQLGLRELQLREQEGGNTDMRARERNVLDYVQGIGRLRLPLNELRALSQRAVAGIVPGGAAPAAPGGAQVAPNGAGGALTADQWQALVDGTARDFEVRQIGQGSALAA